MATRSAPPRGGVDLVVGVYKAVHLCRELLAHGYVPVDAASEEEEACSTVFVCAIEAEWGIG